MQKLTNLYYSQFDSSTESEPMYDSDNIDNDEKLIQSPSRAEYVQYIKRRKDEELLYESWKQKLRENPNIAKEVKEQCDMKVDIAENRVCYIYKPISDNSHIPGIKFKITLIYIKLLRKWYISLGRSRVPSMISLDNKVKGGTYNPIEPNILKLVQKCKSFLDVYVQKLLYIYELIDDMKDLYKDLDFEVNESLTTLKVVLKEKGWPISIEKTSPKDVISLMLKLDDHLEVINLTYEYKHKGNIPKNLMAMHLKKLEEKLEQFFTFHLKEAFDILMKKEISHDTESYSKSLTSSANEL